jgi:hypothetical protein
MIHAFLFPIIARRTPSARSRPLGPLSAFLFGLGCGLWLATWLDIIRPWVSFAVSYPIFFLVMWRISGADGRDMNEPG